MPHFAGAQGTKEDYERAYSLPEKIKDKVWYAPTGFTWLEKENRFWYKGLSSLLRFYILLSTKALNRNARLHATAPVAG